jgi:hypothetical protein
VRDDEDKEGTSGKEEKKDGQEETRIKKEEIKKR